MLACQAAFTQSLTVVTVYATLGEEGLTHGVSQTASKLLVVDAKLLKTVASAIKASKKGTWPCAHVLYIADQPRKADPIVAKSVQESLAALAAAGVSVTTFDDAIAKGAALKRAPTPPAPSDLAVIMYTSGTTGLPKGVMITHSNILAAMAGLLGRMEGYGITTETGTTETYLAYLPLAHIMEMVCEMAVYGFGARVAFGSPHTLTPTGVKIKTGTCEGDGAVAAPTVLVFAPAVLDKVYAGLNAKIAAASPTIQKLFAKGMASGEANWDCNVIGAHWFYNKLVFKKVQALLGGKMKLAGTGSAPLAPKAQKFVQTAFNTPTRQGYGLTETCAVTTLQNACDNTAAVVGPPVGCCCIKLLDWAEGNYLVADANDPKIGMPRGEILIGGPSVCQGYLVDPKAPDPEVIKKNAEEFSTDENGIRWFHTGDVGQITPAGQVQIIDRKKDLVKLQQGEYVALSKVENAIKECPLVELPMCYARSTESYCVALVCPSHAALKALGTSMGLGTDVATLCKSEKVIAEVQKQIHAVVKGKLVAFETPKRIGLVDDPWTPENELLTAAMKLKRKPICDRHKAELDKLYK